jgi:charged multivesicular body protein 2A
MGQSQIFSKKPLKEIIRENQRLIKRAIRELEKEIRTLENSEKKIIADMRKNVKNGQIPAAKVLSKDLRSTRGYITRFIEMKTQLNAQSLKMTTIKSHEAMAEAMKGVTSAMKKMNAKMDIPGLQKVMGEFMVENERSEFIAGQIGDALDDAMADDATEEEDDAAFNQVLDELGISLSDSVPAAPVGASNAQATANSEADDGFSDLEARLKNLGG